jgi:hypothetical protein
MMDLSSLMTADDDINAAALALASIMTIEYHRNPHKNIRLKIDTSFSKENNYVTTKPNSSVMSMANLIF